MTKEVNKHKPDGAEYFMKSKGNILYLHKDGDKWYVYMFDRIWALATPSWFEIKFKIKKLEAAK